MIRTFKLLTLALLFSTAALAQTAPAPSTVAPTTEPTVTTQPTIVPVETVTTPQFGFSHKGKKTFGVMLVGNLDLNLGYESLYVNFRSQNFTTAGVGFNAYFEYGFDDRFTGSFSAGYSRLLYSNKQRTLVEQNFFIFDIMGNYYFSDKEKVQPFVTFGLGAVASSRAVAPTGNVGFGTQFMVADNISLRLLGLYRTAITYHRFEAQVGFGYHF